MSVPQYLLRQKRQFRPDLTDKLLTGILDRIGYKGNTHTQDATSRSPVISHQITTREFSTSQARKHTVRQLNGYRYKLDPVPSSKCNCGHAETVEHFLLQCPLYKPARNTMELNLIRSTGLYNLDLQTLLGIEEDDNIPNLTEKGKSMH